MKRIKLYFFLIIAMYYGCQSEPSNYEKFKLSLESKIEFKTFNFRINEREYPVLNTTIVIVPIDKELVTYALDYKVERDNISKIKKDSLKEQMFSKFINGDDAIFAIFCINKGNTSNRIYFEDFRNNVSLSDDLNNTFTVKGFTPFLENDLSLNSIDKGIIRFDNFRKLDASTYTLLLNNLKIYSGYYKQSCSYNYTPSFDLNDYEITQLLSEGLSFDEIKQQLNIAQQTEFDLLGLIGDILVLIELGLFIF